MTMINLMQKGKLVGLKSAKTPNIYTVRNGCLSESANGYRKDQKPFEGVYKSYDRIIWVDSDNLISAEAVNKLIAHDVDIVAAWYRQYSKGPLGKASVMTRTILLPWSDVLSGPKRSM